MMKIQHTDILIELPRAGATIRPTKKPPRAQTSMGAVLTFDGRSSCAYFVDYIASKLCGKAIKNTGLI